MSDDYRYEIIMYWSAEDQAFIAEVPELPGCAADGTTYQEALANVQVIITEWIDGERTGSSDSPTQGSPAVHVMSSQCRQGHRLYARPHNGLQADGGTAVVSCSVAQS